MKKLSNFRAFNDKKRGTKPTITTPYGCKSHTIASVKSIIQFQQLHQHNPWQKANSFSLSPEGLGWSGLLSESYLFIYLFFLKSSECSFGLCGLSCQCKTNYNINNNLAPINGMTFIFIIKFFPLNAQLQGTFSCS